MVRTQIYITEDEQHELRKLARQSGRRQSELIRNAIDDYIAKSSFKPRRETLKSCRGIWKDRPAADFKTIRTEIEARMSR